MDVLNISRYAFITAFFLYCFGFIFYMIASGGKKWRNRDPELHMKRWGKIAFVISVLGFMCHIIYFFTRWVGAGHVPTSNMYEFMAFLALVIMLVFIIITAIYRSSILGLFTLPLTIIIDAYAAVFPQEVQPIIPALKSVWLGIHVTMAALGSAFFAVGSVAGFMYLIRVIDFQGESKRDKRMQRWLEVTIYFVVVVVAFIGTVFVFRGIGYEAEFLHRNEMAAAEGQASVSEHSVIYKMPPIFKPYNSEVVHMDSFLGLKNAVFETPAWMKGVDAARKWNTVVWSFLSGSLLYGIIRFLLRKPIGAVLHPSLKRIDPNHLDEISYRAIALGFPVYTLGALIFAMIWASVAWGRFWAWDPKEVWALITWLFYSAYLHLRLSRSWHGLRSAWLAVIGYIVVMFTLIGINLIIAGLHSYAGV